MKLKLSLLADTVKRFPAASALAVANTVFVVWAVYAEKNAELLPARCLYASGLGIVLSVLIGPVAERIRLKGFASIFLQAVALAVAGAFAWWFGRYDIFEPHFCWSYFLSLAALTALTACALGSQQATECVFPCAAFAGIVGGASAVAVGGGFTLVLIAVDNLFGVHISENVWLSLWGGAWATVGLLFFLAYVTRREAFEFPKAWRVLFVFVMLPIYLVLLAVLWAYLGKCVVTWSLPNGQINWLVTLAASGWMALYLLLGSVETGFVRAFRRFGALLVVPLVGLQICALQIRIAQYGLTPSRYASVLFVVFALVFAVLSFFRSRWATPAALVFFAALAVFSAHSRWNVIDTGVRCQIARLEAFRARKAAGEEFDRETRYAIMGAWEFAADYALTNGVYRYQRRNYTNWNLENFRKEWGFAFVHAYDRRDSERAHNPPSEYKSFYLPEGYKIDTAEYASCVVGRFKNEGQQVRIDWGKVGEWKYITEPFLKAVEDKKEDGPVVFDLPEVGRVVVIQGYSSRHQEDGKTGMTIDYCYGSCLILRK